MFTMDRIMNHESSQSQAMENPNKTLGTNFQHKFSVNMWCVFTDDKLIGTFMSEYHLTVKEYLSVLKDHLPELMEYMLLGVR
jgi:hypothetical protein